VPNVVEVLATKQNLKKAMEEEKVKGFADVMASANVADGLGHL
jgi:hypothetical protein